MSAILIVYKSTHGQTREIARVIAARLRDHGHGVTLHDVRKRRQRPDPGDFGAVIVGAPIHFGRHSHRIVHFVRRHREVLESHPSAFFSVCMSAAFDTPEAREKVRLFEASFVARTGWRPERFETLAGAVRYTRYGPLLRRLMRRVAEQIGASTDTSRDWVYTDWEAVAALADELAHALPVTHAPALGAAA